MKVVALLGSPRPHGNSAAIAGRILKYKHLPGLDGYQKMRDFSANIVKRVNAGNEFVIDREIDFRDLIKSGPSIRATKLCITRHTIDPEKCIRCGTCTQKCPVNAIDLENFNVDTDNCIACLGCVNNCPVQAVDMAFMGKEVYGYNEFIQKNQIQIRLPEELNPDAGENLSRR